MEINIPPKSDDPQRLIALNGVPQKFWLSASEINQMVNVLAYLLGNRSSLYLGEYDSLFDLELAHPDPAPGSYAQILVEDPNQANKKAEWDNDKKKWIVTGDYDYPTPGGSTQPLTRLDSLSVGWIEGYKYHPRAFFTIDDVPYTDDRERTIVPHATLDKLATFAVNIETRKVEILEGDPAVDPVELQNIDYNKYLVGPFVLIRAGTTQPDNVEVTNLYQENLGVAGGEADTSGGPDFDFANPDNPAKGNVAIKVIDEISASQLFGLTLGADLPIDKAKQLHVKIQNINPGDFHIRVVGKRRGGRIESLVLPAVTDYGYDPNNTAGYQNIILPVVSSQLESIYRVNLVSKVDGWKYYADDIYFSGGEAIPDTGGNNYVTFQDLQSYALNDLSNLVSNLSAPQQDVIKTKLGIVEGGSGSGGVTNDPQIIDLGDILTDTIENAFNDDALAASITITAVEYTVLKAIQNGKNREWLFVGKPDTYEGSAVLATANDFFIGKESPVEGGYVRPAEYNDKAALLAAQGSQIAGEEYTMKNANGWDDPNQDAITHSNWATVLYLGTSLGTEADYELREQFDVDSGSGGVQSVTGTAVDNSDPLNPVINATEAESIGIKKVDINKVNALHPNEPIVTPTYDGSGQTTHPSVEYFPNGFNGWKYWMAHTPYPSGDTSKENPSILVSNDGLTWETPLGITNPIVPYPGAPSYNADPCIIQGYDGKLYVFYCQFTPVTNGFNSKIYVTSSTDGITWSAPILLTEKIEGSSLLSPSVIMEDNIYKMYLVVNNDPRTLERIESASPTSGWDYTAATVCNVKNLPFGKIWHIEVKKYYEEYHIFHCLSTLNNSEKTIMHFGSSPDGINFDTSKNVLLDRETKTYISSRIYKGTAVLLNDFKYAFWYGTEGANNWRIAYTEIDLKDNIKNTTNEVYAINTNTINREILYSTESKIFKGRHLIIENTIPSYVLGDLVYKHQFPTGNGESSPIGLYIKNDGTKAYYVGLSTDKVYEYDFKTIYDIRTLTLVRSFTVTASPTALKFSPDGMKMYIYDNSDTTGRDIYQYNLSEAWNISTAVYYGKSNVGNYSCIGIEMNGDGTKFYITDLGAKTIYELNLSTAYDVTTATIGNNKILSEVGSLQGLWFSNDGAMLFVSDQTGGIVRKYNLSTAYDITTAVISTDTKDVSAEQGTGLRQFVWANNGLIGYAIGSSLVISSYESSNY